MNIANKISTFRILSVPFFIACLVYYGPERVYLKNLALAIFILMMFWPYFVAAYILVGICDIYKTAAVLIQERRERRR